MQQHLGGAGEQVAGRASAHPTSRRPAGPGGQTTRRHERQSSHRRHTGPLPSKGDSPRWGRLDRLRRRPLRPRRRPHAHRRGAHARLGGDVRRLPRRRAPGARALHRRRLLRPRRRQARYDGVRDLLASRGIELPEGDPSDAARRRDRRAASATARTTPFDDGARARRRRRRTPARSRCSTRCASRGMPVAVVSSLGATPPTVLARRRPAPTGSRSWSTARSPTRAGLAGQAGARHLRARRRRRSASPPAARSSSRTPSRACRPGARRRLRAASSASTAAPGADDAARRRRRRRRRRPRRADRPAVTEPPTSAHCRTADPLDRSRFPVDPWRLVESGLDRARPRRHRDALRRRQRLPRHARQRRGGPRRPRARHLRQRLPRDVADPARRGGLRLRRARPDDRQRPRRQDRCGCTSTTSRSSLGDRRPRATTSARSTSATACCAARSMWRTPSGKRVQVDSTPDGLVDRAPPRGA